MADCDKKQIKIQNKTKQNKTKQNKTKQNKRKQNKTKQNKNKTKKKKRNHKTNLCKGSCHKTGVKLWELPRLTAIFYGYTCPTTVIFGIIIDEVF